MELLSGCVVKGSWSVNFWFLFCKLLRGAVELNLLRPLWFTWKGKDGYGGDGGYLQIKIFYFFVAKKTQGKWQEHRENTGKMQGIWY